MTSITLLRYDWTCTTERCRCGSLRGHRCRTARHTGDFIGGLNAVRRRRRSARRYGCGHSEASHLICRCGGKVKTRFGVRWVEPWGWTGTEWISKVSRGGIRRSISEGRNVPSAGLSLLAIHQSCSEESVRDSFIAVPSYIFCVSRLRHIDPSSSPLRIIQRRAWAPAYRLQTRLNLFKNESTDTFVTMRAKSSRHVSGHHAGPIVRGGWMNCAEEG